MSDQKPRIGVAGLGLMGSGIAGNFLRKGYPLTVWNRSVNACDPLREQGAAVADSPAALAAASDFVITSLADPAAVFAVAGGGDGLLAGAKPGLHWIETSTIGSAAIRELDGLASSHAVKLFEAPVTGSKIGARDGTLVVMTGGTPELHAACAPIIAEFAAKVIHVGDLGCASVVKLIGNTIISFMLEGLAEGAVIAEAAGIPLEKVLEVVQASGFASPYWAVKGGAMARRDFETHFSLDLLHKDQALMLSEGDKRKVPLPGLAAIHQVTSGARALGLGHKDIAAQLEAVLALAGLRK